MPPRFERNEEKYRLNRSKHGIGFEEASTVIDGPVLFALDDRENYGEERFIGNGQIGEAVVVVAYTIRRERIRLISARKASGREMREYYEHLQDTA